MKENYKWGENIDDDREWCRLNNRHYCEPGNPWDKKTRSRAVHPYAIEGDQNDGYPGGDVVDYHCPICDFHFEVELPQ